MNIVNKRLWYFMVAGILVVVFIIALATLGIQTGVEFSSGSILNISFEEPVDHSAVTQEISDLGYPSAIIQTAGHEGTDFIIRINATNLDEDTKSQLINSISASLGALSVNEFDNVSPMIASETTRNATIAVVVAIIAMLLYIAFAFRRMPNPFKFGVCAVAGLVLDLLIAMGIYSILGAIRGWQIDLMFIAGVLAVMGYSINNIVVVFDRIRENTARGLSSDIAIVANYSIVETLSRSFNSSLTTLFTLFVLALFVGSSIQNFVIVLIIGVISGVFTSTFISPELLVSWQKKDWGSFSGQSGRLEAAKAKS
ncbi:MAG: protein translocase subunit SecF [Dehalococcoidales bacterium]|nr:protein translocase subunit SecF [Dehalococcoidales bacterium]